MKDHEKQTVMLLSCTALGSLKGIIDWLNEENNLPYFDFCISLLKNSIKDLSQFNIPQATIPNVEFIKSTFKGGSSGLLFGLAFLASSRWLHANKIKEQIVLSEKQAQQSAKCERDENQKALTHREIQELRQELLVIQQENLRLKRKIAEQEVYTLSNSFLQGQ